MRPAVPFNLSLLDFPFGGFMRRSRRRSASSLVELSVSRQSSRNDWTIQWLQKKEYFKLRR